MIEVSKELIERASSGDREAFKEVYKLTSGYVYAVAIRVSRNVEDAQEVVQDVFVKIHKNLHKFKFRSKFTTWIYRITINTAINCYNRSRKKRFFEINDVRYMENIGVEGSISAGLEAEDTEKAVSSMLANLNADQRTCMILREIEGLSYQEISEVLKIKINTVRTRLKRAREVLVRTVQVKGR